MYTRDGPIRAVVQGVYPSKHGSSYCAAKAECIEGSVTFSLEPTVWAEHEFPEAGEVVLLENLRNKRAGWRAKKGRFWRLSDEHQETRKEHEMTIKEELQQVLVYNGSVCNTEQGALWKKWVEGDGQKKKNLKSLLLHDVNPVFEKSALLVLFTPTSYQKYQKELPVYWNDGHVTGFHNNWWRTEEGSELLDSLSAESIAFAAHVVAVHMRALRDKTERSDLYAFQELNDAVPHLLARLPIESGEAELCFREFSLCDVIPPYCDESFSSGYQPFCNLLANKHVPEVWKVRADADMRDRIRAELSGLAKPRAEWEGALDWYQQTLSQLGGKGVYGVELLCDQLWFYLNLVDLNKRLTVHIFPERPYYSLASKEGNKFRTIRHMLAKYAVQVEPGFLVWDSLSACMAEEVLKEFSEFDVELSAVYASELTKWKVINAAHVKEGENRAEKKEEKAQEEENLLDMMRS